METQVPFGDASCCFSEDDWNLLQEWQKELCGNVMKEIHRALISLGPLIASTVFSLRMKGTQLVHPLDNTESERRDCVTSSPSDQSTSHCELFIIKREEHFQLSSPQETEERKDCLSREELASTFIDYLGEEIEESRAGPDLVRKIEEPAPTFIDHLGEEIEESSAGPDTEEPAPTFIDHLGEEIEESSAGPDMVRKIEEPAPTFIDNLGEEMEESSAGPDTEVPRITAVFSLSTRPEEQSCVQETTAPEGQTSGMSDSGSMLVKESTTCCENKTFIPKSILNKYQILQIDDKHTLSTDGKKRTHTGEKPFSCTECPKSFTQLSILQSHHRSHTGMSDSESMLVKESTTCCENKTFIPKSVLNQYQILQIDDKHTVSADGKKVFKRIGNRLYHQKYHTIKDFPCSYCGKSFTQKSCLLSHQRTHTGEKPFSCTECPKSFTQLSILQRHHRSHTGEKPYCCTECGKSFTQQAGLKRHQNIHTGETENLFHCSECGKCFVYKSDLQRHQRIHIQKSFVFKLDFQKDQRIQNDEKSFPCTECGKCFTHQKGLKRHMNIHKGAIEKPFPCSECGKSFVYKSDYLRHQRIHFKKSFCGMAPGNIPVSPNLA